MARPRTAVGTHGAVTVTGYADSQRTTRLSEGARGAAVWVARTRYRDSDGTNRLVEASAPTKARAESMLKAKLVERQRTISNGAMRNTMTVADAADYWLSNLDGSDLSPSSRKLYAGYVQRAVKGSSIERLSLAEVNNVPTLEGWLRTIVNESGTGAAKAARSVVSSVLALAVRHGVLPHSAMRDARTPRPTTKKTTRRDPDRAFTPAELTHVLDVAEDHPIALKHDVCDVLRFLAGTGVRVSEALDLRWEDLDLETGEVHIRGTKTEFADRHLHMPQWLTERLAARLERLHVSDGAAGTPALAGTGVVFHSPGTSDREKPRNRDNLIKHVRTIHDAAGCEWATSHSYRHTVVTRIVEAGHDIGLAADQAGHSDLRTTASYIGRKRSAKAVADVL